MRFNFVTKFYVRYRSEEISPQEGGKRKSKQKWEQNYGSEYISKGSLGLHSAEGFHGVFKSWHGAVLQGLYRFRREMHCLDLHNHVDTSLSK